MIVVDPEFRALIPPLTVEERAQLEHNLVAEGCRDALALWNGTLIDGHNRYELCQQHGISFGTVDVALADRGAAQMWIIRNQFGRRNLQPYARAELAIKLEPLIAARAKEQQGQRTDIRQKSAECFKPVETRREVAQAAGLSHDTISKAKVLDEKASPEIKAKLRVGQTTINREYKVIARETKREELAARVPGPPTGKYRVVYADPPWSYSDKCDDGSVQAGGAEKHYPSMTVADLCALPIRDIAELDAVLFIWVTSPLLEDVFQIIKAWGFQYKTSIIWHKLAHNMGHYTSVRHELLLLCTRGSCLPDIKELLPSVVEVKRGEHSVKPEEFRQMIDRMYPRGERIELFARTKHDGWASWGTNDGAI